MKPAGTGVVLCTYGYVQTERQIYREIYTLVYLYAHVKNGRVRVYLIHVVARLFACMHMVNVHSTDFCKVR